MDPNRMIGCFREQGTNSLPSLVLPLLSNTFENLATTHYIDTCIAVSNLVSDSGYIGAVV